MRAARSCAHTFMLSEFLIGQQASAACHKISRNMAPYSTTVLRSKFQAMVPTGLSLRFAPISLQPPSTRGQQVRESLRFQLNSLRSEASSGVKRLTSALARTARDLACCSRPAVTEKWKYDLDANKNDYENTPVHGRHQSLSMPTPPGPERVSSAGDQQALLATPKLASQWQEADSGFQETSLLEDIMACGTEDAFHAEADETTLALEDEPWDLPIESDVTSDPNVEKEDLSWEMLVMATAEFAAPASDNKSKNLPEQKASSTLEEHIQKQHQERCQAMQLRAAAQGGQPVISAEEAQALRAAAKERQAAAAAERAAQPQEIDDALRLMKRNDRRNWFQEHALSTAADSSLQVADNWEDPTIVALVEGVKLLKGLQSGQEQRIMGVDLASTDLANCGV